MMVKQVSRTAQLACWALALTVIGAGTSVRGQEYPERSIRIIVPTGPGGGYDVYGRIIGDQLSRRLGQGVVVENRTGAGTVVGTQYAIASPSDGYTLLVGGLSNIIFNANLYAKAPYDALKALTPVSINYKNSYMVVTSPQSPYKSIKDLIDAAKAKPGALNLGTPGVGTGQQLTAVAFMNATGIKMAEVPYRGATAVYPDLMAGRVDVFVDSDTGALPFVKAGTVRGLAITTANRSKDAPDVPTMAEAGIPGFDISAWIGLFAPAGTPGPVVAKLQAAMLDAADELKQRFTNAGGEYVSLAPRDLDAFISAEFGMWSKVIKDANIRLE